MGEKATLVLADSLFADGKKLEKYDEGFPTISGKRSLMDEYEYVMHGKVRVCTGLYGAARGCMGVYGWGIWAAILVGFQGQCLGGKRGGMSCGHGVRG